ncbi:MAG TPA: hypothetical protein PKC67_02595 [Kiritimatiellia bacterium]|nr:hypothetical protein [Kiritimatiellia bacterium]HMP33215.1 hypothetical protein [Kiritimatiellia bacterium]
MDQLHPSVEALIRRVIDADKPFDWFFEYHHVAELNRLAHEQDAPPGRQLVDLLDAPIVVGNTSLRRLSWAAIEWYNDLARIWWGDNASMRDLALAWAHAFSRSAIVIQQASSGEARTRRTIRSWANGLSAPWEAIQAAIDALLPRRSYPPIEASGVTLPASAQHSVLAHLVGSTGMPDTYWLYDVAYEHVVDVLRDLAESSFEAQAHQAALLGVRLSEPEDSWSFQAFIRFRNASRAFMDRHGVDTSSKARQKRKADQAQGPEVG